MLIVTFNFTMLHYSNVVVLKQQKEAVFFPTLTFIFPIFGEGEKGKSHIFKKDSFSTFKEV